MLRVAWPADKSAPIRVVSAIMKLDMEKGAEPVAPTRRGRPTFVQVYALICMALSISRLVAIPAVREALDAWGAPFRAPTPKGPIDWKECGKGFECGSLEAPLDYHNISAGNITLSVGRYLATSKDRQGSIFVNPGGEVYLRYTPGFFL